MQQDFAKRLLDFARESGKIALKYLEESDAVLKNDGSVVTIADKEIAKLAHQQLSDLLTTQKHILIDEEDPNRGEYLTADILKKKPFIWAIDPIDGTRIYANRMRHFGISLGLLKDLRPWMGVVYFPLLKEVFFCDGEKAYFIQNAFEVNEKRTVIKPIDQEVNRKAIFLCTEGVFKAFDWIYKDCQLMISACAVSDLCWPTIGRGCGTLFRSNLWDFAGSWPILQAAGFKLRSIETGKVLGGITMDAFYTGTNAWRLKDYYISSSEKNFSILKERVRKK